MLRKIVSLHRFDGFGSLTSNGQEELGQTHRLSRSGLDGGKAVINLVTVRQSTTWDGFANFVYLELSKRSPLYLVVGS